MSEVDGTDIPLPGGPEPEEVFSGSRWCVQSCHHTGQSRRRRQFFYQKRSDARVGRRIRLRKIDVGTCNIALASTDIRCAILHRGHGYYPFVQKADDCRAAPDANNFPGSVCITEPASHGGSEYSRAPRCTPCRHQIRARNPGDRIIECSRHEH